MTEQGIYALAEEASRELQRQADEATKEMQRAISPLWDDLGTDFSELQKASASDLKRRKGK